MTKTLGQPVNISRTDMTPSSAFPDGTSDWPATVPVDVSVESPGLFRIARTLAAEFMRQRRTGSGKTARFFATRSLLSPIAAARWVTYVGGYYRSLGVPGPASVTVNKPLRNYVALGFGPGERVRLLTDHYRIAAQLLPLAVQTRLAGNAAMTLGILNGNRGDYSIRFAASEFMQTTREGELVLFMEKCSDGCILTKATFLFARQPDGRLTLVIGGLQGITGGARSEALGTKREIVDATRSLSQLRPKDVVLHAVLALADRLGIEAVQAVSNRRHVISKLRTGAVSADYDAYWVERQGRLSEPYGYTLPVSLPQDPVPPNKREMHKANVVAMVRTLLP